MIAWTSLIPPITFYSPVCPLALLYACSPCLYVTYVQNLLPPKLIVNYAGNTTAVPFGFTYNAASLEQTATGDSNQTVAFTYDEGNSLIARANPNKTQDSYVYNEAHQIIGSLATQNSQPQPDMSTYNTPIGSSTYAYDANGFRVPNSLGCYWNLLNFILSKHADQ